jgi:hypothetical protein
MIKPDPSRKLREFFELLDIPPSLYEQAAKRYQSLNEWFKRKESAIAKFDPAVYPQGSFRLGTVIRPLTADEEYDLDVVCHLVLLKKTDLTQRQLKELVGAEVKAYAAAFGIKSPVKERKRAWRLDYADGVNFHIDILPCAPEDKAVISALVEEHDVAPDLAASAVALTCKSHEQYDQITSAWPTSNPVGYGTWFERRMVVIATERRKQLVKEGRYDAVEKVPVYELKTPLQRTIQLLKRHRDAMFAGDPELKPISMLITTLAAEAYEGEEDLHDAVRGVLERMPQHVQPNRPRVKNPVNPGEDFADKWAGDPELEENFWAWHAQACRDFDAIVTQTDPRQLVKLAESRFAIPLTEAKAREITGTSAAPAAAAPAVIVRDAPKPWSEGNA